MALFGLHSLFVLCRFFYMIKKTIVFVYFLFFPKSIVSFLQKANVFENEPLDLNFQNTLNFENDSFFR